MPLSLRPHHGLCIRFFQGKGYDAAFIQNMTYVVQHLERHNPVIRLTSACDILCSHCPHRCGLVCESADQVERFDAAVLSLCGVRDGTEMRWSELSALVRVKILEAGCHKTVCSDCQWYSLCRNPQSLRRFRENENTRCI